MRTRRSTRSLPVDTAIRFALVCYLLLPAAPLPAQTPVELEVHCEVGGDRTHTDTTVAVGDVDNDGVTEIVGVGHYDGSTTRADVWIVNAPDCSFQGATRQPIEGAGGFSFQTHVGLLDIDGDGDLEIIGTRARYPDDQGGGSDQEHLIAIHHDELAPPYIGSLAWPGDGGSETSPILDTPGNNNSGFQDAGPTFSDLDADGTVEIVMAFSRGTGTNVFSGLAVYNAEDGSLAWDFLSDTRQGAGGQQKTPTIADLDLDGTMEIIIHNNVVDHLGELERVLPSVMADGTMIIGHLVTAVANFDSDDFPEILARDFRNHYLFEHDGTVVWELERRHDAISQLTVADFDGDGMLEYAHVNCGEHVGNGCGDYFVEVNESDGSLLWSNESDPSLQLDEGLWEKENLIAFDANRDGAFDLVFRNPDQTVAELFIFDGRDGSVLESVPARSSGGNQQNFVVVADIDGDGHAELINSFDDGISEETEIWTGTAANPLPAAPTFRNQWLFNDAYVNEDLSIPASPVPHWLQPGRNGFHRVPGEGFLPILFVDGFESGDLSRWSSSSP